MGYEPPDCHVVLLVFFEKNNKIMTVFVAEARLGESRIVFVLTADFVSNTEPLLQLVDLTYPTKPDAQLRF